MCPRARGPTTAARPAPAPAPLAGKGAAAAAPCALAAARDAPPLDARESYSRLNVS